MSKRTFTFGVAIIWLTGCSSGSSTDSTSATNVGVFVDAPVAGIRYTTDSISDGVTNAAGEFNYLDGEMVTFSIGDINLPTVAAGSLITPLTLAGAEEVTDTQVVNISRLLQSLDSDDIEDRITIGDAAHLEAEGLSMDFESSEFDTALTNFVANAEPGNEIVSAEKAITHLQSSLINLPIFTEILIADRSFDIETNNAGIQTLTFNTDGSGSILFAPSEFNDFSTNDVNAISWTITGEGVLEFEEQGDNGNTSDWVLTLTKNQRNVLTFDFSVRGLEEGVPVGEDGNSLVMRAEGSSIVGEAKNALLNNELSFGDFGVIRKVRLQAILPQDVSRLEVDMSTDAASVAGNGRVSSRVEFEFQPAEYIDVSEEGLFIIVLGQQFRDDSRGLYSYAGWEYCTASTCIEGDIPVFVSEESISLGMTASLSVDYSSSEESFQIQYGNQNLNLTFPEAVPGSIRSNLKLSAFNLRNDARDIESQGDSASVSTSFDNVVVDGVYFDDFSGPLDFSKWQYSDNSYDE